MKIFGLGFHKTGTTSLAEALRLLGHSVTGPNHVDDPDIARTHLEIAGRLSPRFDAFQDNPWPLVFREMDAMWPEARFILTTRDPEAWIRSQVCHFGRQNTPMREWIYGAGRGCPQGNEVHYVAVMQTHDAAVREHFATRPGKLLEIDLTHSPDWAPLCAFLGQPVPSVPFPHANPAHGRRLMARVGRRLGWALAS